MTNTTVLECLGGHNISFILTTYTEYCVCYSRDTDNMVLQSSHCYSRTPMKANIILIPNLITTLEYWCHNGQHVLAAVYVVGSSIICCAAFQLPPDIKNTPAFKLHISVTVRYTFKLKSQLLTCFYHTWWLQTNKYLFSFE